MSQITSRTIADDAVIEAKILNEAVSNAKIADATIESEKYASESIDGEHLSDNAIIETLEEKLLDGYIKLSSINAGTGNYVDVTDKVFSGATTKEYSSTSAAGIIAPTNPVTSPRVPIRDDNSTLDPLDDGSGNQLYGRLSRYPAIVAGSFDAINGSVTIIGTFLASNWPVGSLITFSEDSYVVIYKVETVVDNSMTIDRIYEGNSGAYSARINIFNLYFYKKVSGSETAHTMTSQTIAAYVWESFDFYNIPKNMLQLCLETGGESQPLNHNHTVFTLSSELTSTTTAKGADIIGLDKASTNLVATKLGNGLRELAAVDRHDGRYFTKTEISSTATGSSGSALFGYDNTASSLTATNKQAAIDEVADTSFGSQIIEHKESITIVTQNVIPNVTYTPQFPISARMFFQTLEHNDGFTLAANKSATWNPTNGGFNLEVDDVINIVYAVLNSDLP